MSQMYREVCRVLGLTRAAEKLGSAAHEKVAAEVAGVQLDLWGQIKQGAAQDTDGRLQGLMKVALQLAHTHEQAGEKLASTTEGLVARAASFACAAVVDDMIDKTAADKRITPDDQARLHVLNARAAMDDLSILLG